MLHSYVVYGEFYPENTQWNFCESMEYLNEDVYRRKKERPLPEMSSSWATVKCMQNGNSLRNMIGNEQPFVLDISGFIKRPGGLNIMLYTTHYFTLTVA